MSELRLVPAALAVWAVTLLGVRAGWVPAAILAGLSVTTSVVTASRYRPRSWKPKKSAVSLVWRFTTNSSGRRSPRLRSRTQWVSIVVESEASQITPQCAPPSDRP